MEIIAMCMTYRICKENMVCYNFAKTSLKKWSICLCLYLYLKLTIFYIYFAERASQYNLSK